MKKWIIDFIRGYSDEDLKKANEIVISHYKPGEWVALTQKQFNALISSRNIKEMK